MAFEPLFLLALLVLILGNGAFKPNISTQVGTLYAPGDRAPRPRLSRSSMSASISARSSRRSICGTLGEELGWHYGFAAAGVGMTIGARHLSLAPRRRCRRIARAHAHAERRDSAARRATNGARIGALLAAVRAGDVLLGDLRAAGQHHRAVGRRPHRPHHRSCCSGAAKFRPPGSRPSIRS